MFDWQDYLALAKNLCRNPLLPHEASWRAAASRAYYAALHKSREVVERRDHVEVNRVTLHAEVIGRLKERPETEAVGLSLDRLRSKRAHADYNSARPFPAGEAEIALELAERVMVALGVG